MNTPRHSSGYASIDRLTGGLVPGSVVRISGGAGVGKSTLLMQLLAAVAADGATALLLNAEDDDRVARGRAAAVDLHSEIVTTRSWPKALAALERVRPHVVGLDGLVAFMADDVGREQREAAVLRRLARQEAWPWSPVVLVTRHTNANAAPPGAGAQDEAAHVWLHMARSTPSTANVTVTCIQNDHGPVAGEAWLRFDGRLLVEAGDPALDPWPRRVG